MLVHIIDDDLGVARTVARHAAGAGWQTFLYPSADAFLDRLDELTFGCIVSDIRMPGTSGLDLLQILTGRCPEWPVIIMTAYAEVDAAVTSFRNGAIHFLQKPFTRADFLAALAEADEVGRRRHEEAGRRAQAAPLQTLTPRESEVLQALAQGLQSKNVAWELGISTRTVEMHRSNILTKLGVRNTSQAVGLLQMATSTNA